MDLKEIDENLERYASHFSIEKSNPVFFSIEDFLVQIEQKFLEEKDELNMCFRNIVCNCKLKTALDCICDEDEFVKISSILFQLCSNCKYIVDIEFEQKFKVPKKKMLRIFCFKQNHTEVPMMDFIPNRKVIIHGGEYNEVSFDISDVQFRDDRNLSFSIDYMSFIPSTSDTCFRSQ